MKHELEREDQGFPAAALFPIPPLSPLFSTYHEERVRGETSCLKLNSIGKLASLSGLDSHLFIALNLPNVSPWRGIAEVALPLLGSRDRL